MNAATLRSRLRWFHIAIGLFIGAYFYSPLSQLSWPLPLIQCALIPLLACSGIVLWKQAQFMKWLKKK